MGYTSLHWDHNPMIRIAQTHLEWATHNLHDYKDDFKQGV